MDEQIEAAVAENWAGGEGGPSPQCGGDGADPQNRPGAFTISECPRVVGRERDFFEQSVEPGAGLLFDPGPLGRLSALQQPEMNRLRTGVDQQQRLVGVENGIERLHGGEKCDEMNALPRAQGWTGLESGIDRAERRSVGSRILSVKPSLQTWL